MSSRNGVHAPSNKVGAAGRNSHSYPVEKHIKSVQGLVGNKTLTQTIKQTLEQEQTVGADRPEQGKLVSKAGI